MAKPGIHLPGDRSPHRKPRLLLVEDQPAEWVFYGDLLQTDYEVQFATNGEEAWQMVRRQLPDLILSDVLMPILDGIDLTRRLRANPGTASVPIILMTASHQKDLLFQGLEAGSDDFLIKPFHPLELISRLRCQCRIIELRRPAAEEIARLAAEEVECAKNHFLASLSHELRTPLTPVHFGLHALRQRKGLPLGVYEGLEMIHRNVETETRLINDLLDVSQIVYGKLALYETPTDLHACILQAKEECRGDFAAKEMSLTVALDAGRHRLLGDADRLRQVFWHLLQNAAKFTPPQGQIHLRSANDGEDIVVEVADSGRGITPEDLPKIFLPFEHGGSSPRQPDGGLGLGLAVAHAIVTAHEGQLTVASLGLNQGSTFRVYLNTAKRPDPLRALRDGKPLAASK